MVADVARQLHQKARYGARALAVAAGATGKKERRAKRLIASGQLVIGPHGFGQLPDVIVYQGETERVVIGSFCGVGADVRIFVGGNHRMDWISTFPFRIVHDLPGQHDDGCIVSKGDVVVGHDALIGQGATLMSGVRVGNGAVIGACAVVASDVPPYAIAVGNPARVVRKRFSDEQIALLERIAWWEWPLEKVLANVDVLSSPDVDALAGLDSEVVPCP